MKKLKIRYKNQAGISEQAFPKTRKGYILKSDGTEIDKIGKDILSANYNANNEFYGGSTLQTIIAIGDTGELKHYGNPTSLGLIKEKHYETIEDFSGDGNSTDTYVNSYGEEISLTDVSLKDIIENKKVKLDSQLKVKVENLPEAIKGQMRYSGNQAFSLATKTDVTSLSPFTHLHLDTELKKGMFVIASSEGYLNFDGSTELTTSDYREGESVYTEEELVEALEWNSDTAAFIYDDVLDALNFDSGTIESTASESLTWYNEDGKHVYIPAGTFIIFLGQNEEFRYEFALIERQEKAANFRRYGMVKYGNETITSRSDLSDSRTADKVIGEATLKKLGFDITSTSTELIFESFE